MITSKYTCFFPPGLLKAADDVKTTRNLCNVNDLLSHMFFDKLMIEVKRFRKQYNIPPYEKIIFDGFNGWLRQTRKKKSDSDDNGGDSDDSSDDSPVDCRTVVTMSARTNFNLEASFTKVSRTVRLIYKATKKYDGFYGENGVHTEHVKLIHDHAAYVFGGTVVHRYTAKHEKGIGRIIKFTLTPEHCVDGVHQEYFSLDGDSENNGKLTFPIMRATMSYMDVLDPVPSAFPSTWE